MCIFARHEVFRAKVSKDGIIIWPQSLPLQNAICTKMSCTGANEGELLKIE